MKPLKPWVRPGEVVGGGFVVMRRGRTLGRIMNTPKLGKKSWVPFEHPTLEAATAEATRLAKTARRGGTYCVFQQVFAMASITQDSERNQAPDERGE